MIIIINIIDQSSLKKQIDLFNLLNKKNNFKNLKIQYHEKEN
jgi:hypothetical protein